jgi:hypothetical protein
MSKQTSNKFSPEVRCRAVRLVLDHEQGPERTGEIVLGRGPVERHALAGSLLQHLAVGDAE